MKIDINGQHLDITPALRDYVNAKFERLQRHFDNLMESRVILAVDKLDHKAEATITASGVTLFADAVSENMYAAIDLLADKLDRQVIKHKEKLTDHRRGDAGNRQAEFG